MKRRPRILAISCAVASCYLAHISLRYSREGPVQLRRWLTVTQFTQIYDKLQRIITECDGAHNKKFCTPETLRLLCMERASAEALTPTINYTDSFTPWLTLGRLTWTANDYNDFITWYIFFSGSVVSDVGRRSGQHFYFESGASNGIHASQTYTFGEQLSWKGLITEVSNCGPCQATINHPSARFLHTGICKTRGEIPFDPQNQRTFCPLQIPCEYADFDRVQCQPLRDIFHREGVDWVDFLSLDMEEATPDAWHSVDHVRTNVRVAVVESWPEMHIDAEKFDFVIKGGDYFIWRKDSFELATSPCLEMLSHE